MFCCRCRSGGQVACLAIGDGTFQDFDEINMNNGEITGISFQKVDEGIVQTVVDFDKFSPVDWEHPPTINGQQQFLCVDDPVFAPTQKWHDFCNLMFHLRDALLKQVLVN